MEITDAAAMGGAYLLAKKHVDALIAPTTALLGKSLRSWVKTNVLRMQTKTKKILDDERVAPRRVSFTLVLPIIEAASRTDDETLSGMFARLLASQLRPETNGGPRLMIHPSFAQILSQMAPLDAKLLSAVDEREHKELSGTAPLAERFGPTETMELMADKSGGLVDGHAMGISLQNLLRVGLLSQGSYLPRGFKRRREGYIISIFGAQFTAACIGTKDYWRRSAKRTYWDNAY